MLLLVTTSLRPVLTDLGLNEVFDSEMRVPPIASLQALEVVLKEVQLFSTSDARRRAVAMLAQAGFGGSEEDEANSRLNVGIKKLLSMIEMARQEPEAIAERLTNALMGLGM